MSTTGIINPIQDREENTSFRLNRTGNILYATTNPELQQETRYLFDSVTVLFSAMTKALSLTNKDLFSRTAWKKMIERSGFFAAVQQFHQTIENTETNVAINTQVVSRMIPGIVQGGPSMTIAKSVMGVIDGKYRVASSEEKSEMAHVLFICEEIFGAPLVTVRIFNFDEHTVVNEAEVSCGSATVNTFKLNLTADSYLFVSPEVIQRHAGRLTEQSEAYNLLVKDLAGHINESSEIPVA